MYGTYYSGTRIFMVSDELLWCPMNYYRDDELNYRDDELNYRDDELNYRDDELNYGYFINFTPFLFQ